MTAITLITGGAASGKSRYACERAARCGENVLFVATCVPGDDEMRAKVARHRAERPSTWRTVEGTREIAAVLAAEYDAAIIACLTLLISQMFVDGVSESEIDAEVTRIFDSPPCRLLVVTNEVGCGIVPENALARRFRELAGRLNRIAAECCDEVILMVCGVPVWVKGAEWKG